MTGGIIDAGVARSPGGVHWPLVKGIALSWIVALPAAATIAAAVRVLGGVLA